MSEVQADHRIDFDRYKRIKVSREGRILILSLSNPKLMNAVDGQMHRELSSIFLDAADDPHSDVVMLTGEGNAFCAGGDLGWMRKSFEENQAGPDAMEAKRIIYSLLDMEKPIVSAVQGPAVGLGATIALMCDVIYAGRSARFVDPHVKVGIVAGDGGAVIWPQLIGYARAKEYLMTGDPVKAPAAEQMGLINHMVEDEDLWAEALAFAQRLERGAIQAIKYTKVSVNIGLKQLAHTLMDTSVAYEIQTFSSQDHKEAVTAFLEKRPPNFIGR